MNRCMGVCWPVGMLSSFQLGLCASFKIFRRCDSNPAQYERNRRFGQLVHTVARAGNAVKLPSVGL